MTDRQPTPLGPGGFAVVGAHAASGYLQGNFARLMIVACDRAYDIY